MAVALSARRRAGAPREAWSALACAALILFAGCSRDGAEIRASGTVEMDEIDVSSRVGGRLVRLAVDEGDTVRAGDTLAVLDQGEVAAQVSAQLAQARSAQAQAQDLRAGSRPAEVLAARADAAAAESQRVLAQREFERTDALAKSGVVSAADLDRARAARDAAAGTARAAAERLRLLEEGARRQQVEAAKDAASAAAAELAGARSRAGELVLVAPQDGVILLRNFRPGELVPAATPVVTLGDPERLWIRVYVEAPKLPRVRRGARVDVRPIGSRKTYPGRVVAISPQAEFTPRAALTEDEQANLVFGVKVALDPSGGELKPGLPAAAHIHPSP